MSVAIWGRDEQGAWHLLPKLEATHTFCGKNDMRVLEMRVYVRPIDETNVCTNCSRMEHMRERAAFRYEPPARRCRACRSTNQLWKCRRCSVRCCEHRCSHRNGQSSICFDCKETERG